MALSPEQAERIGRYMRTGDRGREPVFVGRAEQFRLLENNAHAARDGDTEGRTVCLSGPPGIGKSAFLSAFAEKHAGARHGILPVAVDAANLHSPGEVLSAIGSALSARHRSPMNNLVKRIEGLGFRLESAGGKWLDVRPNRPIAPPFPWDACRRLCDRLFKNGSAVALLVDEAQSTEHTPGSSRNVLLRSLHEGRIDRACPVFAVCAGHAQTPQQLFPSISYRYATGNEQPMPILTDDDSVEYVDRMLDHLRLGESASARNRQRVCRWVADECGGWPHHLANAMRSIAGEALRADTAELGELDGHRIAADLSERRRLYYDTRLSAGLSDVGPEISSLLRKLTDRRREGPDPPVGVAAEVLAESVLNDRRQWFRPLDSDVDAATDWMDRMVRTGILSRSGDGRRWGCAIDNLRRFIESGEYEVRRPFPNPSRMNEHGC